MPPSDFDRLTDRERQCLWFMASGLSGATIAESLSLSQKAVEKALAAARAKLSARNAPALAGIGAAALAYDLTS
jgi:DNA-binding CsgD family transcriptional regulator